MASRALTDHSRKRFTLLACIIGSAIVFVDSTAVNVALPAMQDDLGGGLVLQQWVVDAYLLTLGSLILVGGSLADLFGERRVFGLGVAAFVATSVLCALAPTGNTLIGARGLQGVAGALLTPAALATIAATFSGEERGAAIGSWTAWGGISTVIGPLLGGWLVGVWSWRGIFLINVPLGVACLALIFVVLPRRAEGMPHVKVDVVGGVLCTLGLAGPVFALIEQTNRGWSDPLIVGSLVGGMALFAVFLVWEARSSHPMLPLSLFSRRNFSFANIETFTVYAGLSTLTFFLILFVQQIAGYSALQSGMALLPITIVLFVLSRLVGRLTIRLGPRLFMGAGPLICAVSLLGLLRLEAHFSYWLDLLPPMIGFALGLAMIVAPLTATVLADADERDAGIASGVNNAVARVAGLLGIAVVGAAIAGSDNKLDVSGFHVAMAITAVLVAAGGVIGIVGIRNVGRVTA